MWFRQTVLTVQDGGLAGCMFYALRSDTVWRILVTLEPGSQIFLGYMSHRRGRNPHITDPFKQLMDEVRI